MQTRSKSSSSSLSSNRDSARNSMAPPAAAASASSGSDEAKDSKHEDTDQGDSPPAASASTSANASTSRKRKHSAKNVTDEEDLSVEASPQSKKSKIEAPPSSQDSQEAAPLPSVNVSPKARVSLEPDTESSSPPQEVAPANVQRSVSGTPEPQVPQQQQATPKPKKTATSPRKPRSPPSARKSPVPPKRPSTTTSSWHSKAKNYKYSPPAVLENDKDRLRADFEAAGFSPDRVKELLNKKKEVTTKRIRKVSQRFVDSPRANGGEGRVQRIKVGRYEDLPLYEPPNKWVLFDPLLTYPTSPPPQVLAFTHYEPGKVKVLEYNTESSSVRLKCVPEKLRGREVEYTDFGPRLKDAPKMRKEGNEGKEGVKVGEGKGKQAVEKKGKGKEVEVQREGDESSELSELEEEGEGEGVEDS